MTTRSHHIPDALIAGAVGATALNAITYLDMTLRGRPASHTPETSAARLADTIGLNLGPEPTATHRRTGLGALLGYTVATATALTATILTRHQAAHTPTLAITLGLAAMLTSTTPTTLLGVTNPRHWTRADWLSDLIPHLAYGTAAAWTWRRLTGTTGQPHPTR